MGKLTILALQIVIAMVLAGSLFIQLWMVPLIVLVLRTLLAQAVARDAEAKHLRDELDEVI